jgi:hypothetical protein
MVSEVGKGEVPPPAVVRYQAFVERVRAIQRAAIHLACLVQSETEPQVLTQALDLMPGWLKGPLAAQAAELAGAGAEPVVARA